MENLKSKNIDPFFWAVSHVLEQLRLPLTIVDANGSLKSEAIAALGQDVSWKIFKLANRVADGFNPERELNKLRVILENSGNDVIGQLQQVGQGMLGMPQELVTSRQGVGRPPWSHRNSQAIIKRFGPDEGIRMTLSPTAKIVKGLGKYSLANRRRQ